MKKITLLNAHLIIKEKKTGVHIVHEEITKRILKHANSTVFQSIYLTIGNKKIYNELINSQVYSWIQPIVKRLSSIKTVLLYMLPIELFCGKSDAYLCDGIVPYSFYKSKRVAIVHDCMTLLFPQNYTFIQKTYAQLYFRRIKYADEILVVSNNTKQDLIKLLNIEQEKIKIITLGCKIIEDDLYNLNEPSTINFNQEYFYYMGDMRINKNLYNAISAFQLYLLETNKDTYFYIAGSQGFEFENLKQLVKHLSLEKRVIFLGYISDSEKRKLIENGKALFFVSQYEGFGIPIIEAAICGTPFITSNTSSMKDLGKGSQLLVDPQNVQQIAQALIKLEDQSVYEQEVQLGAQLKAQYTWDNCYQQVFDSLISK